MFLVLFVQKNVTGLTSCGFLNEIAGTGVEEEEEGEKASEAACGKAGPATASDPPDRVPANPKAPVQPWNARHVEAHWSAHRDRIARAKSAQNILALKRQKNHDPKPIEGLASMQARFPGLRG